MNRTITRASLLAFVLLFSLSLLAQAPARRHPVVNPDHPLVSLPDVASGSVPTSTFGGTFTYSFTITLKSTFPSDAVIVCSANAGMIDLGTGRDYEESASVVATKGSSHAVCTVRIPYSWLVGTSTATSDTVNLGYSIFVNSASSGAGAIRESIVTLGTVPLPANGATTATSIAATI